MGGGGFPFPKGDILCCNYGKFSAICYCEPGVKKIGFPWIPAGVAYC